MARKKQKKCRERREFAPEFKADVVRLCATGAEKVPELCRRLDLNESVVRRWIKRARADEAAPSADAIDASERAELTQLRRENLRLRQEREILKKAAAFFARENL